MTFLRFKNPVSLEEKISNPVIAVGNFDGVHRGHQVVLQHAIDQARTRKTLALALTFEPHPQTLFRPHNPVYRLTPSSVKARIMDGFGLGGAVELSFTSEFANLSADEFVDQILVSLLRASHVVTGYDFHFGKGRQGSPEFLVGAGQNAGFDVSVVQAQTDEANEVISSSRIRSVLRDGDVGQAAAILGYRYQLEGEILKGAQIGRTLGYPTANICVPEDAQLKYGIYAARLRQADGSLYDGVASFGRRPTFDNGAPLLEIHLFDFSQDLYGETCVISLFSYLRGEEKFDCTQDLIAQMDKDAHEARQVLMAVQPLSPLDAIVSFSAGG